MTTPGASQPSGATLASEGLPLNAAMAEEVLRQAQEVIKAQLAAGSDLAAKLTTVLGQAVSLALASFGAAAIAETKASWLPGWAAVGLLVGGLLWCATAAIALRGLRPEDWLPPGFEPMDLWRPEVLTPAGTAEGYLFLAAAIQENVTTNRQQNVVLARTLLRAQRGLLIYALGGGVAAGALTYAMIAAVRWTVTCG